MSTKNEAIVAAALAPGRRDRLSLRGQQAKEARDELCAMRSAMGGKDAPLDHLLMGAIRALGMAEHYAKRARDHLKATHPEPQLELAPPIARREDGYVVESPVYEDTETLLAAGKRHPAGDS